MNFIKTSVDEHVGVITLCNPPVNVLTFDVLDEMSAALDEFGSNDSIWSVIVCSNQKIFSAGVDAKNLGRIDREGNIATSDRIQKVFLKFENFEHPVICAVNGKCIGGGLEFALSCDLRVLDEKASVVFPECGIGIAPGAGGSQRLTKLAGKGIAKRMIYTCEPVSASECLRLGICEYVAEEGRAFEKAMEVAKLICTKAPGGIAAAKKAVAYAAEHSLTDGLKFENEIVSDLFETEDRAEGISAMFAKRKPEFKNR